MIHTVQRIWIITLSIALGSFHVWAVPVDYSNDIFVQPVIIEDNKQKANHAYVHTERDLFDNDNYQIEENMLKHTEEEVADFKEVLGDYEDLQLSTAFNNKDSDININSNSYVPINKVNHFFITLQPNSWNDSVYDKEVSDESGLISNNKNFIENTTVVVASTSKDILHLKKEIERHGKGHELLVYFYLFRDLKYYYLGYLVTDSNILRDCLSRCENCFCVDMFKYDWSLDNLNNSNINYVKDIDTVNSQTEETYSLPHQSYMNDDVYKNYMKNNIQTNYVLSDLSISDENIPAKNDFYLNLPKETDVKGDNDIVDLSQNNSDLEVKNSNMGLNPYKNATKNLINMEDNYSPEIVYEQKTEQKPEYMTSGSIKYFDDAVSIPRQIQKYNAEYDLQFDNKINNYNDHSIQLRNRIENQDDNIIKKDKCQIKTSNLLGDMAASINTLPAMNSDTDGTAYQLPSETLIKKNLGCTDINYESRDEFVENLRALHKDIELDKNNYIPTKCSNAYEINFPIQKKMEGNTKIVGVHPKDEALKTENIKANSGFYDDTKMDSNLLDRTAQNNNVEKLKSFPRITNYQPLNSGSNYLGALPYQVQPNGHTQLDHMAFPVDKQIVFINTNDYNFHENNDNITKEEIPTTSNKIDKIPKEPIYKDKTENDLCQVNIQNQITEKTMPIKKMTQPFSSKPFIKDDISSHIINLVSGNAPQSNQKLGSTIKLHQNEYLPSKVSGSYIFDLPLQKEKEGITMLVGAYPNGEALGTEKVNVNTDIYRNTKFVSNVVNLATDKKELFYTGKSPQINYFNPMISTTHYTGDLPCYAYNFTNNKEYSKNKNKMKAEKQKGITINTNDDFDFGGRYQNIVMTQRSAKKKTPVMNKKYFNQSNFKSDFITLPGTCSYPFDHFTKTVPLNKNEKIFNIDASYNIISSPHRRTHPSMYEYDNLISKFKEYETDNKFIKKLNRNKWYEYVQNIPSKTNNIPRILTTKFDVDNVWKTKNCFNKKNNYNKNLKSSIGSDINELLNNLPLNRNNIRTKFKIEKQIEHLEPISTKHHNFKLLNKFNNESRLDKNIKMHQSPSFLIPVRQQQRPSGKKKYIKNFGKFTHYFPFLNNGFQALKIPDKTNFKTSLNKKRKFNTDRTKYFIEDPSTCKNAFDRNEYKINQAHYYLPTTEKSLFSNNLHEKTKDNRFSKKQHIFDYNFKNMPPLSKPLKSKQPSCVISVPFSAEITKPTPRHSSDVYKKLADYKPIRSDYYYSVGGINYNPLPYQAILSENGLNKVFNKDNWSLKNKKLHLNLNVGGTNKEIITGNKDMTESNQALNLADKNLFENKLKSRTIPAQKTYKYNQFITPPKYSQSYLKTDTSTLSDVTYYRTNTPQTVLSWKFINALPMDENISQVSYLPYQESLITTFPFEKIEHSENPKIPFLSKIRGKKKKFQSSYLQNNPSYLHSNVKQLSNPFILNPIMPKKDISYEGLYKTPTAKINYSISSNTYIKRLSKEDFKTSRDNSTLLLPNLYKKTSDKIIRPYDEINILPDLKREVKKPEVASTKYVNPMPSYSSVYLPVRKPCTISKGSYQNIYPCMIKTSNDVNNRRSKYCKSIKDFSNSKALTNQPLSDLKSLEIPVFTRINKFLIKSDSVPTLSASILSNCNPENSHFYKDHKTYFQRTINPEVLPNVKFKTMPEKNIFASELRKSLTKEPSSYSTYRPIISIPDNQNPYSNNPMLYSNKYLPKTKSLLPTFAQKDYLYLPPKFYHKGSDNNYLTLDIQKNKISKATLAPFRKSSKFANQASYLYSKMSEAMPQNTSPLWPLLSSKMNWNPISSQSSSNFVKLSNKTSPLATKTKTSPRIFFNKNFLSSLHHNINLDHNTITPNTFTFQSNAYPTLLPSAPCQPYLEAIPMVQSAKSSTNQLPSVQLLLDSSSVIKPHGSISNKTSALIYRPNIAITKLQPSHSIQSEISIPNIQFYYFDLKQPIKFIAKSYSLPSVSNTLSKQVGNTFSFKPFLNEKMKLPEINKKSMNTFNYFPQKNVSVIANNYKRDKSFYTNLIQNKVDTTQNKIFYPISFINNMVHPPRYTQNKQPSVVDAAQPNLGYCSYSTKGIISKPLINPLVHNGKISLDGHVSAEKYNSYICPTLYSNSNKPPLKRISWFKKLEFDNAPASRTKMPNLFNKLQKITPYRTSSNTELLTKSKTDAIVTHKPLNSIPGSIFPSSSSLNQNIAFYKNNLFLKHTFDSSLNPLQSFFQPCDKDRAYFAPVPTLSPEVKTSLVQTKSLGKIDPQNAAFLNLLQGCKIPYKPSHLASVYPKTGLLNKAYGKTLSYPSFYANSKAGARSSWSPRVSASEKPYTKSQSSLLDIMSGKEKTNSYKSLTNIPNVASYKCTNSYKLQTSFPLQTFSSSYLNSEAQSITPATFKTPNLNQQSFVPPYSTIRKTLNMKPSIISLTQNAQNIRSKIQNINNVKKLFIRKSTTPLKKETGYDLNVNTKPSKVQFSINRNNHCKQKYKDMLKNKIDETMPMPNIVIAKYEPFIDDYFIIQTEDNNIELKAWRSKLKILKPRIVYDVDEVTALNFIPITKKYVYPAENAVNIAISYVSKNYGDPIVINGVYSYSRPYAIIKNFNINKIKNNTATVIWPTFCNCGCCKSGCQCLRNK